MSLSLIRLANCGKDYVKHKYNLEIKKGNLYLISGANGSGKTTLIRLILGFIAPDFGLIEKNNYKVSYLPERSELPGHMTSLEYLKINAKIKKTKIDLKLILNFEIPLYQKISLLSKGNKQKVAIIATLAGENDLIVLDEPLSGLDTQMIKVVKNAVKEQILNGVSFLISTHNPNVFKSLAHQHLEL